MTRTGFYQECNDKGGMSKFAYDDDPKRLAFTLARYKHTAKILEGRYNVLEVGCSDGYGSRIVRQHVENLTAIDTDEEAIKIALQNNSFKWPINFLHRNLIDVNPISQFSAIYMLDVLEHINLKEEDDFLTKARMLAPLAVVGMPSLESQVYASRLSKEGHVNCKKAPDLKKTLENYWRYVFIFTMHDETLGTSYSPMAHYLLAVCAG